MLVTASEVSLSSVIVRVRVYGNVGGQGSKGTARLKSDSVIGATKTTTAARGRRGLLLSSSVVLFAPSSSSTATAMASQLQNNDSKTALLQKYLKKSEVNKTKNDKERLDDYYKRNYKDYFEFFEGSVRGKTNEQLSEAEKGILSWLETNK
ncbi:uncharacterized protein LOC122660921 [Telopea speciosissima]|uniref:uncharacterized protein LOC122660921 n=1 Tax=Telopea speciosissima TaxID=54955 RepID=UPI001CC36BCA|nr:uncharacterized protein LOC122660921 [Telopea speciosissima]